MLNDLIKRLKSTKIVKILITIVLFKVKKNGTKKVLREWRFKFSLRFRRHFFSHTKFCKLRVLKTFFFNIGLKGVIEKCVGCFLLYLFLRGFFDKKGVTKQGCVCV